MRYSLRTAALRGNGNHILHESQLLLVWAGDTPDCGLIRGGFLSALGIGMYIEGPQFCYWATDTLFFFFSFFFFFFNLSVLIHSGTRLPVCPVSFLSLYYDPAPPVYTQDHSVYCTHACMRPKWPLAGIGWLLPAAGQGLGVAAVTSRVGNSDSSGDGNNGREDIGEHQGAYKLPSGQYQGMPRACGHTGNVAWHGVQGLVLRCQQALQQGAPLAQAFWASAPAPLPPPGRTM